MGPPVCRRMCESPEYQPCSARCAQRTSRTAISASLCRSTSTRTGRFDTPPELKPGCARRQCYDELAVCVEIRRRSFGLAQDAPCRRIRLAAAAHDAHTRRDLLAVQHADDQLVRVCSANEPGTSDNPSEGTNSQSSFERAPPRLRINGTFNAFVQATMSGLA